MVGMGHFRVNHRRLGVAFAITGGAATIAVAGASLPSPGPSNSARAAAAQLQRHAPIIARAPASTKKDAATARFTGQVGTDLSKALIAAGVPELQGREYVGVISRAVPLANGLSVQDRFDLILLRNSDGSLGQLVYAGLDRVARADLELMKWTDGKHVMWMNAESDGAGDTSQTMRMPVSGRITSGFGERFHPILGYERFHDGVDLGAPAGTPIVAAADGRVVSAGWAGGYGRAVQIAHTGGVATRYGHMSRIAAYAGEQIRKGDVIGYVGSTGLSTGPHLHFEVLKNGRPVNPLSVKTLVAGSQHLEGARLAVFDSQLRTLLLATPPGS